MRSTQNPARSTSMLVVGAVAFVVGVLGIVGYIYLASQPAAGNDASSSGLMQGLLVICAAACTGLGLVLVTLGVIKRMRR